MISRLPILVWTTYTRFTVALNEFLSGHHATLDFKSAKADFVFFSQCRGPRKGNIQLQSKLVLWIMFVIQLMHYPEAAGCGTSIQLALSATVHQSANYFLRFSSFNY